MADTNLSISIKRGDEGFKHIDFTFGTLAPNAGDVEVRINAVSNGQTLRRIDVRKALDAIIRVLDSSGTYTTDLDQ